jgi:3-methyladenine DNA glycosylase AlkD
VLTELDQRFEAARDPIRAVAMAAYMRDQFAFFGIANPQRVRIERAVAAELGDIAGSDLLPYARAAWREREREHQYAAARCLRAGASQLPTGVLDEVGKLITTKPWWDTVDELAAHVVGPLVRSHRSQRAVMDRWLVDDDIWLARTAILHQLTWKSETDADWLFAACLRRAGDREFFIRKAIGWALRTYSYVDAPAVERFVEDHRDELSGLSAREALKAVERQRRRDEPT